MRNFFIYIFLLANIITLPFSAAADTGKDTDRYVLVIDSLLDRQKQFDLAKQERLNRLKKQLSKARTVTERFVLNDKLYDEYSTYRADSALKYIDNNIAIAEKEGNGEWRTLSLIKKTNLLTGAGLLNEAMSILRNIDTSKLDSDALIEYYGEMIYLFSHMGDYAGKSPGNNYYAREYIYTDSIMAVIKPAHPDYLWYKGWQAMRNNTVTDNLIDELRRSVVNSDLDSRYDAKNAYVLSRLFKRSEATDSVKKYLALSAIADIKTANAEIASMKELSELLFREKDIDRAYNYINYSLSQSKAFPNRVRIVGHLDALDDIYAAYQEKNRQQEMRIKIFLCLVCMLAIGLSSTAVIIMIQNSRLRNQQKVLDGVNMSLSEHVAQLSGAQKQLADANAQLKGLNEDLKKKNDELHEANYVKEEYIGYVFNLCSNNIRKLEELRTSIHAKAVTGKIKDIERMSAGVSVMKDELKEFYHSFDSIFLHIYPDFVKDFNALLQDDKQIVMKEGELLNTELRIYALVRLGITDSVKIAEFLHCSPQTVYNNRFRMRSKAKVGKDEFVEAVKSLGRFSDSPMLPPAPGS